MRRSNSAPGHEHRVRKVAVPTRRTVLLGAAALAALPGCGSVGPSSGWAHTVAKAQAPPLVPGWQTSRACGTGMRCARVEKDTPA